MSGQTIPSRRLRVLSYLTLSFFFGLAGAGVAGIVETLVWLGHGLSLVILWTGVGFALAWALLSTKINWKAEASLFNAVGGGSTVFFLVGWALWSEAGNTRIDHTLQTWQGSVVFVLMGFVSGAAGIGLAGKIATLPKGWIALGRISHWVLVLLGGCTLGALTGMAEGWIWEPRDEVVISGGVVVGIIAGPLVIAPVYLLLRNVRSSAVLAGYTLILTLLLSWIGMSVVGGVWILATPIVAILIAMAMAEKAGRIASKPREMGGEMGTDEIVPPN